MRAIRVSRSFILETKKELKTWQRCLAAILDRAYAISEIRLTNTYMSGLEGGALTSDVCTAVWKVAPAGLATTSVSAPTVTESWPAPSINVPRASRTSSRPTFTSKRSWPEVEFNFIIERNLNLTHAISSN